MWKGRRSTAKRYSGDNRLIGPKSPYRRTGLAPRCRLVASWGWSRSQGSGCSPVKAVRELGLERQSWRPHGVIRGSPPAHIGGTLIVSTERYSQGNTEGRLAHGGNTSVLSCGISGRRWKYSLPTRPAGRLSVRVLHPSKPVAVAEHVRPRRPGANPGNTRRWLPPRPRHRDERPGHHQSPGPAATPVRCRAFRDLQASSGSEGARDP